MVKRKRRGLKTSFSYSHTDERGRLHSQHYYFGYHHSHDSPSSSLPSPKTVVETEGCPMRKAGNNSTRTWDSAQQQYHIHHQRHYSPRPRLPNRTTTVKRLLLPLLVLVCLLLFDKVSRAEIAEG